MGKQIGDKMGKGITPAQFMDTMEKNKDAFRSWYKQFSWSREEDQSFFASLRFRDDLRCLILMAEWCGDVVRNVPVVLRALEEAEMPVEVLVMEDHLDTMDQYLTMGGRAIPIVIFADTGGLVLGQWGPRPRHVQEVMTQFKQANPDRAAADYEGNIKLARQEMMRRYGDGTAYQSVIVEELRELLSSF